MRVLGILNITEDSFSDGGQYLDAVKAIEHANELFRAGADVIDVGPVSSHPDSKTVSPAEQIARLRPVISELGNPSLLSVDSPTPEVQLFALRCGVGYINDIRGFPDPSIYRDLAASSSKLIVMHSVSGDVKANRPDVPSGKIISRIVDFFDQRLEQLTNAGIPRERIIIDPGMGFFLGTDPETSLEVIRHIPLFRDRWRLPVLVSVSRKSFLQRITGEAVGRTQSATLAAEVYCFQAGANYIRTHEPRQLKQAVSVWQSICGVEQDG